MMTTVALPPWREPAILDELVAMCQASGTTDVAIMYMCHPQGFPLLQKFGDYAAQFRRIKVRLDEIGVRSGILFQTLVNHSDRLEPLSPAPFQRIVGYDGTGCPACFCPLDPDFLGYVNGMVTQLAKAGPSFFLVDDDVRLDNHSPAKWACACPRHIELFNRLSGHSCTREELFHIMHQEDESGRKARISWQQAGDESLLSLMQGIRSAIDAVDPTIRCGKCISYGKHMFRSEPIIRALAGGTVPLARLAGGYYSATSVSGFSNAVTQNAIQRSLMGAGIELLCEADTFPHSRHETSVKGLRCFITTTLLAAGVDVPYTWIPGVMEWIRKDVDAYSHMLGKSAGYFGVVKEIGKSVTWLGPTVIYKGPSPINKPWSQTAVENVVVGLWGSSVCGRLGIPFTCNDPVASVKMLDGDAVYGLTRTETEGLFSGGLLLDGAAAINLSRMGFDELMGVHVQDGDEDLRCDAEEFGSDRELNGTSTGKSEWVMRFNARDLKRITPVCQGVRIASEFVASPWFNSTERRGVSPALTVFENRQGGRVAVYAHTLGTFPVHVGFMNDIRKEQLLCVMSWLGGERLLGVAHAGVDTYCLYGQDTRSRDQFALIVGLGPDDIFPLVLNGGSVPPLGVEVLKDDQHWESLNFTCSEGRIAVEITLGMMNPLVMRIRYES